MVHLTAVYSAKNQNLRIYHCEYTQSERLNTYQVLQRQVFYKGNSAINSDIYNQSIDIYNLKNNSIKLHHNEILQRWGALFEEGKSRPHNSRQEHWRTVTDNISNFY